MKKLLLLFLLHQQCFAQEWQVGAAQASINPDIPAYIAGHTQNRTFKGFHDSLYVKAVVISSGSDNVTILTYDCIGMLYPVLQEVRRRIAIEQNEIKATQIMMSSTHTHAGPDVVGLWGPDLLHSGVDSSYMRRVVNTSVEQIRKAWASRRPAKGHYGQGSYNAEWVHNISQPNELDKMLTVIRFRDGQGNNLATLTNFACHPTFVDAVHHEISADYPGGFYQTMDRELGGVNLFLQGAIGGWVQPEGEPQTFEQAFKRGDEMARTAMALLNNGKKLKGGGIQYRNLQVAMPVSNPGFTQLAKAGVIKRNIDSSVLTEIAMLRVGNAMMATHPGETVPAMSLATRSLMKTKGPKMIMGLSMDALGYILKPDFFDPKQNIPHSKYLCSMSVGPEAMTTVMEALKGLASQF